MTLTATIEAHEGFIAQTARSFLGRGIELDDLIQEARLGAIEAFNAFDETLGRFTTFSFDYMRRRLFLACRDNPTVSIPEYVYRHVNRIKTARVVLTRGESLPTDAEVATYLIADGMKPAEIANGFAAMRASKAESLNVPDAGAYGMRDRIAGLADHRSTVNNVDIGQFLDKLTPRQRKIIDLRYGLTSGNPLKCREIAAMLKITKQAVNAAEKQALRIMGEE